MTKSLAKAKETLASIDVKSVEHFQAKHLPDSDLDIVEVKLDSEDKYRRIFEGNTLQCLELGLYFQELCKQAGDWSNFVDESQINLKISSN